MKNSFLTIVVLLALIMTGCRTPRNITYMQGWESGETQCLVLNATPTTGAYAYRYGYHYGYSHK